MNVVKVAQLEALKHMRGLVALRIQRRMRKTDSGWVVDIEEVLGEMAAIVAQHEFAGNRAEPVTDDNVYLLKAGWDDEYKEVTKEEWIKAERAAGLYPKCASDEPGFMTSCATGGFSGPNCSGSIRRRAR